MTEVVSLRIPSRELNYIGVLAKEKHEKRSAVLREVLERGIREERLDHAIAKFRDGRVTAWKAARLAGIPLTEFLDTIRKNGLEFHYSPEDFRKDVEGL